MSEKEKLPQGRPPKYNEEFAKEICEYVSSHPDTDEKVAKHFGIDVSMIYFWRHHYESFSELYRCAKKKQMALRVEKLYNETYETCEDVVDLGPNRKGINNAAVGRLRVRANLLAQFAGKFDKEQFGDKQLEEKSDRLQRDLDSVRDQLNAAIERNRDKI